MFKHNRSQFLMKDTHEIFGPRYNENSLDIQKEYAKNCYKLKDAIPISSLIIQNWFREDLYALMNVGVTPEQSKALSKVFKYIEQDVKEICFANNNFTDAQFASLLSHMIADEKQFNDL